MSTIALSNMLFYAHHGCFSEERIIGTRFRVDIELDADTSQAQLSDKISDTVHYQEVYNTISAEMSIPSALLENVAARIVTAIRAKFPTIQHLKVKVAKLAPPLGGDVGEASVTLFI